LKALPKPTINQFAQHATVFWDPDEYTENSIIALTSTQVPKGIVYIITDVEYYAIAPSAGLNTPPIMLNDIATYGTFRWEMNFSGRSPAQIEGALLNPLMGNTATGNQGIRSGWHLLNQDFGSRRELSWAVYATEDEEIRFQVIQTTSTPQFPVTALGVQYHGFSLPVVEFSGIWEIR
jgi:hypothetical protein